MFEEIEVKKKDKAPKKSNIYKAVTSIRIVGYDDDSKSIVSYVRAKTSAGAAKIAREAAVTVTCVAEKATQEDLLALAGNANVIGEQVA